MAGTELSKRLSALYNLGEGIRGRLSKQKLKDTFERHAATLSITSTFDAFLYAYAITSSRLFTIDTYHQVGLVPVADLFNHVEESTIALESDLVVCDCCGGLRGCMNASSSSDTPTPAQTLDIVTTLTAEPSEELFNSYGDALSNVDLAIEYGFVLEANEFDKVTFGESISKQVGEAYDDHEQELFVNDLALFIDSQARVSLGLFGLHDSAILNSIVLAYEQSTTISDGNVRHMIQKLLQRIDERIAEYPTDIDTNTTHPVLVQMRDDEVGLLQTARMRFIELL